LKNTHEIVDECSYEKKLSIAISCLLTFIEVNFTGTASEKSYNFKSLLEQNNEKWKIDNLNVDGIEINANIKLKELLFISRTFINDLISLDNNGSDDIILLIWHMRAIKTHQKALDENSITLYDAFRKVHKKLSNEKLLEIKNLRYRFLIELEIMSIYLMYRRVYIVEDLIEKLKRDYQIDVKEEGHLGLRTKWQQKPLPQFHVSILQRNEEISLSSSVTHEHTKLLELLKLEDDTRLESVKFLDEEHNQFQSLSSLMQNFVQLYIQYKEISQPKDKLSDEEIKPFIMLLLQQPHGPYSVRLNALMSNIKFEANNKRTVDRSLRQCEELVTSVNNNEIDSQNAKQRISYIFSTRMMLRHKIEEQLADLMISLGLVKGALDVYLKIQKWDNVITCYAMLQLRHKAAEVIKQELEKHPTTKLYCLLGDTTDDVSCYEQAWNFSKRRSGLAQSHWGNYYFNKSEYESAIPHLQKSLEINSLQENLWLRLGFAALTTEKYELAASAYLRYTQLEPNGFESWNNLAKCFIMLGDKKRAHKVLQESLKCNFDNWKIWENFLIVSVDIGSFEDAINSFNRLIELKEKYFDEQILVILVKAIADNLKDNEGNDANRLKKKALEMLAHLGSIHVNEGVIWELSALISPQALKKAEKLQKAYRGFISVIKLKKFNENFYFNFSNFVEITKLVKG
jgi:tetratricopeptide (TPR) repeat protein